MGFFDRLDNYMTGPQRRAADMANEANALRVRQAQREEENLLRRQQAVPALMNRLNTSGAMLPEGDRTIENSIFSDRNTSTNELLGRVDPEAAMKQSMAVAYPEQRSPVALPKDNVLLDPNNDYAVLASNSADPADDFTPKRMKIPGTNRIAMARTPDEYNAMVDASYVEDSGAVPGVPDAAPRDFSRVDKWREGFDKEFQAANEMDVALGNVVNAIDLGGATLGTAIQLTQKIIDQKGVVRGEDVTLYKDAVPIMENIQQEFQTRSDGQLTPASKARMKKLVGSLAKSRFDAFRNNFAAREPLMRAEDVDPNMVIPLAARDRFQVDQGLFGGPAKGAIVDGYEFLGGDPNDKNNYKIAKGK
tara:strand:- start:257 stop:1342 length:1086 start_codon:yes stop_codon:yes gene_type:complete